MQLSVISVEECSQVHERSLKLLASYGLRVESARGRALLRQAGASVDETTRMVRLPEAQVEQALKLAPRDFNLGSRRPRQALKMNAGECHLLADGGAMFVLDGEAETRRLATHADWVKSTRLIDALYEISLYWWMARDASAGKTLANFVAYWRETFSLTSKHIQDATESPEQSRWLLEILQVVFGDRKTIQSLHPVSMLVCPVSPLTIDEKYTDAYLEMAGWNIPVVAMPMPLMGTTAPGRLISTMVLGNCEVLALLCLVQAAAPGTPFIYAPALAVAEPYSGLYRGGAVEHSLLGAGVAEMARFYGLPVEASAGGTDRRRPGIQAAYERAINWVLPMLAWPDILVGPGLLEGSTVLSYEQLMIDLEIYRRSRRLHQGLVGAENKWLDGVIEKVGAGGNFLAQRSTREAMHAGEWYLSPLDHHNTSDQGEYDDRSRLMVELREKIDQVLAAHQPVPLDETVLRELEQIEARARRQDGAPA